MKGRQMTQALFADKLCYRGVVLLFKIESIDILRFLKEDDPNSFFITLSNLSIYRPHNRLII